MNEILDRFMEFENKNKLFELTIDNIYFWELVRRRISDNILLDLKYISNSDYTVGRNMKEKILYFLQYSFNAFINKFKKIPKVDAIIINHPRKIKNNGEYVDIYTYYLQEEYKKKNISFLTLDVPFNWHKHLLKKERYIRYMENFSIIKKVFYKYFYKNKLANNEILLEISKKLKEEFNTDGNLINTVNSQISNFKADYKYFKKILKKAKPKTVSIVISEVYPGVIKAAKDLKITTVEIQHGVIDKYHLAYNYPYNSKLQYFPDKIRLFGEYWYDSVNMPLEKKNIILTENRFLINKTKGKIIKNKKQILFITQGWITKKAVGIIEEFCKLTSDYDIYVKLHPSEFEIWKVEYPDLLKLETNYGVKIIDNFDKNIYDWLSESKFVVGVSSTCLYEALYFDCNVHLLKLPSIELMQNLINNGVATVSKDAKELLKNIKTKTNKSIDLNYYYYREEDKNE